MHNRPAAKSSMIALIILIIVLFSIGLFISIYPSKGSFFFVHPERLTALLLLPLIFMFFYRRNRAFNEQSRILANPYHSLSVSKSKTWIAQFLKSFVFSMLIISWAYPCLGDKKNTGSRNRKEWVFCLDLSNSMNVRDISGESRLEIAQRLMNALTHHFHEEAVSLCTFAGNAHEEIPLTIDYA
ncbi:MAG: VWA domain-containing protein, partial [Flavobacteriia bacterium]|nr:VWA domain-containing protein [Flavobacteriia bacterium]